MSMDIKVERRNKIIDIVLQYLPFLILFILTFVIRLIVGKAFGDDTWFSSVLNENVNIFSFLIDRYMTWSSRLVNEFFLITITRVPFLWKMLDSLLTVLGAYSLAKLFNNCQHKSFNWVVCALIMSLPIYVYLSCGFMSTTIGYFWVMYIGLFTLIPLRKIYLNEKIRTYEYPFYILALLFSSCHEQMCFVFLVTYLTFFIIKLGKDRKPHWFHIVGLSIITIFLAFILACPGDKIRLEKETTAWYPSFNEISIFEKIERAYSATMFEFALKPNFIYLLFIAALAICLFLSSKKIYWKLISLIPIVISLVFIILIGVNTKFNANLMFKFRDFDTNLFENFIPKWLVDVFSLLSVGAIIVSLFNLFKDKRKVYLCLGILLVGGATRMMMAFSPTIYVSGSRTYIFMFFAFIAAIAMLVQEIKSEKVKFIYQYFLIFIAILSFINTVVYITTYLNLL